MLTIYEAMPLDMQKRIYDCAQDLVAAKGKPIGQMVSHYNLSLDRGDVPTAISEGYTYLTDTSPRSSDFHTVCTIATCAGEPGLEPNRDIHPDYEDVTTMNVGPLGVLVGTIFLPDELFTNTSARQKIFYQSGSSQRDVALYATRVGDGLRPTDALKRTMREITNKTRDEINSCVIQAPNGAPAYFTAGTIHAAAIVSPGTIKVGYRQTRRRND